MQSPKDGVDATLSDSPQMTLSHMEQVHDLMADAMMESNSSTAQSGEEGMGHHKSIMSEILFIQTWESTLKLRPKVEAAGVPMPLHTRW